MKSKVSILTGGGDRPYALGLAHGLIAGGVPFDFVGSDDLDSPDLRQSPQVRFLNLRGDQRPDVSAARKVARVAMYYARLIRYAAGAESRLFHILWNNKFELIDRTILLAYYKLCGKRIVVTVHNVNVKARDGGDGLLNRLTLRAQYRLADHLFVHTRQMSTELQRDFQVPAAKVSVIPFGINDSVPQTALTRDQARQRLGLGRGERSLLFFGNIAPYKGLDQLADSVALLSSTMPDLRLIIAGRPKGSESYWAGIRERMARAGLDGRLIERIEFVPDADAEIYFKAADVLVLPYLHVYQSGVLFLGYSFGLPVIATNVGSLQEDVVDGTTGFMCAPGDRLALAGAIQKYFASDLYRNLQSRRVGIRRFAAERHSWAQVGAMTTVVYENLLGDRRRADSQAVSEGCE